MSKEVLLSGFWFRTLRNHLGYTQQEVADVLFMTPGSISRMETGKGGSSERSRIYYQRFLLERLDPIDPIWDFVNNAMKEVTIK